MGVKPKPDNPEQLMKWMSDFLQPQNTLREDSETRHVLTRQTQSAISQQKKDKVTKMILNHPPKIAWFSDRDLKSGDETYKLFDASEL